MFSNTNTRYKIKTLLSLLALAALFLSLTSSCGNGKPKVYRVGILVGLDFFADIGDSFRAEMTELGYIEGENIVYDIQQTNDITAYKSVLEKFVADEVDLIFVFPTEAALEAKTVTQGTGIPVLFAAVFIEGTDIVESVRQPGGDITGVRFPGPDLAAKSLETLLEIAPQTQRVWIPYLQGYINVPSLLEAVHSTADNLGVTIVEFPTTGAEEVQAELLERTQSEDLGMDAIMYIYEPLCTFPDVINVVTEFSAKHHIPVGNDRNILYLLIINNIQVGKQAAPMADKILKGISAGTIPVASAERFLTINFNGAQELGLTVPENLLRQADEILR